MSRALPLRLERVLEGVDARLPNATNFTMQGRGEW